MDNIKATERRIEEKKVKNEELDEELTAAQKRAAIAEAKKQYGKDWKHMIGGALKSLKVDKESLQTLHSLGVGGSELRNLSNPAMLRKYK